jgi:hypothetical protein
MCVSNRKSGLTPAELIPSVETQSAAMGHSFSMFAAIWAMNLGKDASKFYD